MIINKINAPIYGLLILLSIIIGITYVVINLKKEKIHPFILVYFVLLFISFAFFGSLAISYAVKGKIGLNSYAGAVSLIVCSIIYNKIVPKDNIYLKYSILSFPLIYAIGKIGCFIVGCCYGIPYNGLFSVTYTSGLNRPLFPIQIVETIVFLILFIILNHFKNKKNIEYITIIVCSLVKFLLDYLRYEHINKILTTNQIVSLIFIIISIIIIIRRNLKK